ncbi:MAG: PAS domain S-box protein [Alphaproteobacteria bacterium]
MTAFSFTDHKRGWRRPWRQPTLWLGLGAAAAVAAASAATALATGTAAAPAVVLIVAGILGAVALLCLIMAALVRSVVARRGLEEENRLLAGSLDAVPTARLIVDPQGQAVYGNNAFRAMFDDGKGWLKGLEHHFSTDPEARDKIARLQEFAAAGESGNIQLRIAKPGSEAEWLHLWAHPVAGCPGFVVWRIDNITSKRQMEQILREEQDRLVDFLENASVGFYSVDGEGCFKFINHTLAKWLGYSPDEITRDNMRLHDFISGDISDGVVPYDPFLGPGAPARQGEVRLRRRDGGEIQAYVMQTLVEDESGIHTRSVVRDLTSERELQQVAVLSQQRFQRLFEDAPLGIAIVDLEGRVSDCNPAFLLMTGTGDVVGANVTGLVVEDDRGLMADRVGAAIAGEGSAEPFDVSLMGEGERIATTFITRLEEGGDNLSGLILHFIDTTGQRDLEMQFSQSQKMQAVGQLAGGIAHDFNNLLTVMIGFCDLLLLRHRPGEQNFADIMQIKQNANRAANLVRQLLAFSRQQTLQPKVLDITDVLAEITDLLRRLIGVNVDFKVVHGRELGLVKVDKGQFEQIIINLAVNARDAMAEGGNLTLTTSNAEFDHPVASVSETMPPGRYIQIDVADTGTGIDKANLERIFEPFFSTKEVGSGTGLGLSTVYGTLNQTGGFIAVDSEVGKGTTFHIYLPRFEATDEVGEAAAKAVAEVTKAPVARDLTGIGTVLLVEDEDAVRLFGARALRNKGYKVYEAKEGEGALNIIQNCGEPIDLVITDVVMPNVDGPTLVRQVRQTNPAMKVIFISGYAEDSFREQLSEQDDIHFLPKPFSLEQLAGKVKEVILA